MSCQSHEKISTDCLSVLCLSLAEAIAAVHRAVVLRFERNFCFFTALCTDDLVHLALLAALAAAAALVATITAASRFVLEALLSVEFLFTGGEDELLATFFARECLVLESHKIIPLLKNRITHQMSGSLNAVNADIRRK